MSWGVAPGSVRVEGEIDWVRRPTPPGKRLHDQIVVVTGASRGFGRLIALAAADEGAHVVVNYAKSAELAARVVKEIEAKGRKAIAVQADVSKYDQVKAMADKVWEVFGRCDVLINNAGETAATKMSWRDLDEKVVDETLNLDVKGTLFCTHEFGRRMLDLQKSGTIVNICSNVIVTGSPRAPEYAAAKYGVLGITKSYALALAPYVRVNAVGPGYMDTESLRARKDWTPERRKWIVDHTPLRSIGKPENIVHIVMFLASQDSFHMTGNLIICDGGFSMPGA
jgi:NAD(P)-dependent dehydrogenase (short-subunit alcohol dehydrogenase family)